MSGMPLVLVVAVRARAVYVRTTTTTPTDACAAFCVCSSSSRICTRIGIACADPALVARRRVAACFTSSPLPSCNGSVATTTTTSSLVAPSHLVTHRRPKRRSRSVYGWRVWSHVSQAALAAVNASQRVVVHARGVGRCDKDVKD